MKEKLKRIAKLSGKTIQEFDGNKKYYSTGNINTDNYEIITYKNRPSRANIQVAEKDILIAKMKNTNKTTIATKEMENNVYSTGFTVLNTKKLYYRYLYYLLCSPEFIEKKDIFSVGTTQIAINDETLMNLELEYIQDYKVQKKVADYLEEKITEVNNVIQKTKETIEDYKKYKKNFIIKVTTKGLDKNTEMKDTDSEWIGKIPKHWNFVRINTLFNAVDERNEDENAMLLSLYTSIGVKPRNELEEKGNKAVTVLNYKKVKKNDIIVNKLLAWMGAIAYSDYEGVTSPDYDVYRAKEKANAVKNYYNAYFRYTNFNGDCHRYGHGIMLMRWRTYPEELLRIKVPNPPYKEQIKISKVIDEKCSEIDKLIENKEKIIEELEKYKKSLIYEYVTGKKEVV